MRKTFLKAGVVVAALIVIGLVVARKEPSQDARRQSTERHEAMPSHGKEMRPAKDPAIARNEPPAAVSKAGPTAARLESYPVPSGNVSDVFNRLKARADTGDATASFGIYQKLRQCMQLPKRGMDDGLAAAYAKAGRGDAFLQSIEQQTHDCEGATALLEKESAGAWLERAADQGALIAQLVYAADQETVLGTPMDMIKDPEKLIRYKQKGLRKQTAPQSGLDRSNLRVAR